MRIGWAAFALFLALGGSRNAVASTVYGPIIAREYATEAEVDGATVACLYCHPTTDGKVVTKSFGLEMMDRGLKKLDAGKLRELLDELMAELDTVADPLGPEGVGLLDTDLDDVPDALEIRWGSDPSNLESTLAVDPDDPGAYLVSAVEHTPVTYGCGAQLSPSTPPNLTWASTLALFGAVACGRRRPAVRRRREPAAQPRVSER